MTKQIVFPIAANRARRIAVRNGIHQDQEIEINDLVDEIQRGRSQVNNLDAAVELISGVKTSNRVRAYPVVPQQNVADSGDENSLHRTLISAILRPSGSNA